MFEMDTLTAEEAIRELACIDTRRCSDAERLSAIVDMERIGSLVEVVKAHLLADLDADHTTDVRFGKRTASWVASEDRERPGTCCRGSASRQSVALTLW